MIKPSDFYELLKENGFDFFAGVPDSLLKNFNAYVSDHTPAEKNIITANEGNAIALAAGYYLAQNNAGIVYMQNSGLGNCINPLTSLTDPLAYSVPMLLIIGWRGEPGKKDEPQHLKQGAITIDQLKILDIEHAILPESIDEAKILLNKAKEHMEIKKKPFAIIVKKDTFESYTQKSDTKEEFELTREEAMKIVSAELSEKDIIVSTTGKLSRELFEFREEKGQGHEKDFLTIGCMGHASSIALGIALEKSKDLVYCFDGDGALIMHMGALATVGKLEPKNFKHIVFNNLAHDSVGGQETAADFIDIPKIALANGYKQASTVKTKEDIKTKMQEFANIDGPTLIEIKVSKGARKDLGRPTIAPIENKNNFMKYLSEK